jgi:energy-coupling factor transporter ATP-binding protein EcfA2
MNEVTTRSILVHVNGYCSQKRTPVPPFKTIEEGVDIVQKILLKEVLCKHDVDDINQVYSRIDSLEQKAVEIPDRNSKTVLEQIIEKTEMVARSKDARDLISLYHLRRFVDPKLQVRFKKQFEESKKTSERPGDIATSLPYCMSSPEFDKDTRKLLGKNRPEKIEMVLTRKKKILSGHEELKQLIQEKKAELEKLRQKDPEKYPDYFDELIDNGYIHLYDHLIKMRETRARNDTQSEVKEMSFSILSHIVLEAREAIVQKVEASIPPNAGSIVFLLGASGVGKSTTLCYLRGDEMELKDFKYSSKEDKVIIGHQGATSCTFLPTVEVVNNLFIIDVPGFDDTNGQLISLGVEFALKALIQKYRPKILVLEAITNDHGRYASVAQLGRRLTRLLDNKEDCVLGITKYSQDPNCQRIETIETEQRRDMDKPTEEEEDLRAEIRVLSRKKPAPEGDIADLQKQLEQLQLQRAQNRDRSLPDTPEKERLRNVVVDKERDMLAQVGVGNLLRFDDLGDHKRLMQRLAEVVSQRDVRAKGEPDQDPNDSKLLDDRFQEQLLKEIETKEGYYDEFESVKDFEESILGTSLVRTIFAQSNPEIGQLLHLPEIDPKIVRAFDFQIVRSCLLKYKAAVVKRIVVTEYQALVNKVSSKMAKKNKETIDQLKNNLSELMRFILSLEGVSLPSEASESEINKAWIVIQARHTQAAEADYKPPKWIQWLKLPTFFADFLKKNQVAQMAEQKIEQTLAESCESIEQTLNVLTTLVGIEKLILKQDEIASVFSSEPISIESEPVLLQGLKNRIVQVRAIYEAKDWDERIEKLKEKFFLRLTPSLKDTNYLGLISQLLDENISCIHSKVDLTEIVKEMGQEEDDQHQFLLLNPNTILIKGKLRTAMFEIAINQRFGKETTTKVDRFTTNEKLQHGISQFMDEMDMKRPLFRALLAGVILNLFEKAK